VEIEHPAAQAGNTSGVSMRGGNSSSTVSATALRGTRRRLRSVLPYALRWPRLLEMLDALPLVDDEHEAVAHAEAMMQATTGLRDVADLIRTARADGTVAVCLRAQAHRLIRPRDILMPAGGELVRASRGRRGACRPLSLFFPLFVRGAPLRAIRTSTAQRIPQARRTATADRES
jgi:hypothetical protein